VLLTNPTVQDIFKDQDLQLKRSVLRFFSQAGLKKIAAAIKASLEDGQERQERDQTVSHDLILDARISLLRNQSNDAEGLVITLENLTETTHLRTRFKQYTSDQVAEHVLATGTSPVLGGQERQATMLFVDISGSIELLGRIGADEMVNLLNLFFTSSEDIIYAQQGTLNKYTGDGFLAVWGVPKGIDDANQRALTSALAICRGMDTLIKKSGFPLGVKCGISSGTVLAGNIGSLRRMEYTVIGPDVNLAARLCDKARSGQILVSPSFYNEMHNLYDFKSHGLQIFKGNRVPLEVYQVIGPKGTLPAAHIEKGMSHIQEGTVRIDLNLPMMTDIEFAASYTLQAVGVLMDITEDKIEEIKLALIEACINAIEHSQSKESRMLIGFEISPDALIIKISDRGHGFDKEKALKAAGQRRQSGQLKRGWGLHLMQEFVDETEIESDSDGTTITLKKYC
jgi:class 3 adenylate cyclase/anti-sigma regulatory factor (Ser/Thr protein kinase)